MTLKNPMLERVFLALRPNFFENEPRQHVTLRYYNRIRWDVLMSDAARMEKYMPATIEPVGYNSWQAWGKGAWHFGLLVKAPGSMILDHLQMPHVTLDPGKETAGLYPYIEYVEPQLVDTLWIGKSINSQLHWAKVSSKQIEASYEQFGLPHDQDRPAFNGRKSIS